MTWEEYRARCSSLAERFARQGETWRANYWRTCSGMNRDWPKRHQKAKMDAPALARELERDEELCEQMERGEQELCLGHS